MTILNSTTVSDHQKVTPTTWTLRTATGESAKVYGEMVANFRIGGRLFKHRVLVAGISEDIILGMDFLSTFGLELDLKKKTVTIGEEEVVLLPGRDGTGQVRLISDITIPARSQVVTKAKMEGDVAEGTNVLLEPELCEEELGHGILVARTLFLTSKEFPVLLMNMNDHAATLKKGSKLGHCSTVTSVVHQVEAAGPEKKSLPRKLEAFLEESCQELTKELHGGVRALITKYQDVFEIGEGSKGRTSVVKHAIDTGEAKPIRQNPRRLPLAKREEARKIIKEMEDDGIIEPSNSPWVSPVVLVKKKDDTLRFCVDYRMLNNVTKKDSYPLPRIDDTLDSLEGCKLFSTLDLKSGYWQVGLEPKDKEKTAFSIGEGLWQFTVMPFGLCNAPATFERLMENVLRGLSWETCLVYLDDIIVLGKSFEHHLENLEQVFRRLRQANLKLNPKKCNLFRRQVNYLGHVVSDKGVAMDPGKVEAITKWPVPRDKHEVRSFLGLCAYYRRFVKGFSNIAKPLTKLTEDKRSFIWDADCQQAFETLKEALSKSPILGYPRPEGKFILDTDASNTAIGGVLSQEQDGEEKVIGYFSKVLSKPERNYCVTRRELLAVVKSIAHFHKYLYGRRFLLRTDHAALMWLLRFKSPEGQVARWLERLQEYDFESVHRAGTSHRNADALSRRPCEEDCKHCSRQEGKEATVQRTTVTDDDWAGPEMLKDQEEDPDLKHLWSWRQSSGERPSWQSVAPLSPYVKTFWAQWDSIVEDKGILKRVLESATGDQKRLQIIVPRKRIPEVLQQLHDGASGGHFGVHKTLEKVRERFYWPNLKEDVKNWCRNCTVCASANGPLHRRKAPMQKYNVGAPFERIAIDIAGPFPVTDHGNKYILVAMDYFSKWVEAYALPNQEAITVADVLVKEFISRFGVPMELHSDQGRNFESSVFSRMCEVLGIHKTRTTALHPQSDGMVERMNRTMGKYLSKVVSKHQRDWDQYLHLFLMAYRSSVNESTRLTPANIIFGRELRLPCDLAFGSRPEENLAGEDYVTQLRQQMDEIHETVRSNIQDTSERMKERYDIKADQGGYHPGDLVWLYNPQRRRGYSPKLQTSWEGPYEVVTRINDVIYRIKRQPKGKPRIIHFNRLAPYHGDNAAEATQDVQALQTANCEFDKFMANLDLSEECKVTTVSHQDLFALPKEYALAHCVTKDLESSRGIATVFRKKFGGVQSLKLQEPAVGRALHHQSQGQHLFYLVTKDQPQQESNYQALWESLIHLRSHLQFLGVKKLGIPKLGCGYDGLDWRIVRPMLEKIFRSTKIRITVCVFSPWQVSQTNQIEQAGSVTSPFKLCELGPTVLGQNSLKEGAVLRSQTTGVSERALACRQE